MNVIWWFAGLFATFYGVKIVFRFFKRVYQRLGNEDRIDSILDGAEEKLDQAADNVAGYWKKKKKQRKEEQPIITIR